MANAPLLRLSPADQVAVALSAIASGTPLGPFSSAAAANDIPAGHKVALASIAEGAEVFRLGQPIGLAARAIAAGEHVHIHNLSYPGSLADPKITVARRANPMQKEVPTFLGFRRADGRVGTRNTVLVLTSVNCSALVARMIGDHFRDPARLAPFPDVDAVVALTHKSGCSLSEGSPSMRMLRRTLGGYARHPNVAGVLIVGLGCEDNQIDRLLAEERLVPGEMLRTLVMQETGGTRSSIAAGIAAVEEMLEQAATARREPVPASELMVGLQCGGSDSFSGISANPALGLAVDRLVACGGTAILSETPEIYGAENLLLERAVSPAVGAKLVALLEWWERYTANEPEGFDVNPSPGNRAGGLTTILEKSLGAVAKGGSTNLVDVVSFAEPVTANGLVFMDSPGYDPISATGQVAGGANLVAFTTGRGSCYGCRPAPSLKLATNSALFAHMEDDMDVNCGVILDQGITIEEMGRDIFERMIRTASGELTKSEILGYGDDEFAPWHINAWL
jgi:altronate hydrolase